MTQSTLLVDQFGAFVGKHSERLQVKQKGQIVAEAPVMFLEQVLLTGKGVSMSADAIALCAGHGIPVHYLSGWGQPYAALYSAGLGGTVLTRRAQYLAYEDVRGVALAAAFAGGKIENQGRLLKYMAKSRKEKAPEVFAALRQAAQQVAAHLGEITVWRAGEAPLGHAARREQLLSIEGRAAQHYWDGLDRIIPEALAWPGRKGRGARDPFNAALNYGYGVLYGQVERAIILAGLDPYAGFIHTDRPGKPSLVLDLIEEFRAPVVDRSVLAIVGQGIALDQDKQGMLTQSIRRTLAERVLERLEDGSEKYEDKRQKLRWILQSQARHLAAYLRGEREKYAAFKMGW
ncbi:MAG: CRISPR-associated endonuclease Cas1 [Anaerolineae bacterium]|nr:CRISPR-associated endonuclease Cas1 [Anaerolineae bacterium]